MRHFSDKVFPIRFLSHEPSRANTVRGNEFIHVVIVSLVPLPILVQIVSLAGNPEVMATTIRTCLEAI